MWPAGSVRTSLNKKPHHGTKVKTALLAICPVAVASAAVAEEPDDVKSLSLSDCTLPRVIMARRFESLHRNADTGKVMMPTLDGMRAISAKAKDNARPITDQLSVSDLSQFNVLRSRLIALQMRQVIESRYDKHLQLLQQMALALDNGYRWSMPPDPNGPYAAAIEWSRCLPQATR
jgi:hypothetical protein